MNVTKRNGTTEPIDINKIDRVLTWAAEGLNVSVSDVELKAHMQFCEGIKTSDIHEMLIKSAADLITEQSPDYQYMAARLAMFHLRKKAYGEFNPPMFVDHVVNMVRLGLYDKELLTAYSMEDLDILGTYLDHDRDLAMTYAAVKQWEGKYLVQDRVTKRIYESPQMAYMLIAMAFFGRYPKDERLTYVIAFYNATSNGKISLPTPIMGGMRTPTRQFSSCVLIDPGDSLDSINASASAVVKYVSQRAGIGINIGRLRALGSPIRGGEAFHTGLIPFIKHFQTAVKSCSQGAIRGGAATLNYPFWHLEVESLLVLKNNRGTEETRVRHLDYVIQLNKLAYERLIIDDQITLFSPGDVPDLYDAFLSGDADNFERLYTAYEFDKSIRKKHIRASELFTVLMQERAQTGRVYVMNIDHVNSHGAFNPELAPVSMTNLCVAPETRILTEEGYKEIASVAGTKQRVWNGHEWSEVDVVKTGTNQPLITVVTDTGQELTCTPYHKFYVQTGYNKGTGVNSLCIREVRAGELREGDKLIKLNIQPVQHGMTTLEYAYENGFFTGDGCQIDEKVQRIYLYGEKAGLPSRMRFAESAKVRYSESSNRYEIDLRGNQLCAKFFVPSSDFTLESRLEWFAGLADADGTIARNGDNQSLQITSVNKRFLMDVQLALQEMGIQSRVSAGSPEGYRAMPDGHGGSKDYWCQNSYRLLVGSSELQTLMTMGFSPSRLRIETHCPNRSSLHFSKVVGVYDNGRVDDTYCFSEPLRHMGVFNGLLTGQCVEITLPTKPMTNVAYDEGEIALCTLAAFNLGAIESLDELESLADLIVRALDALLDYQDYPVKAAELARARRALGVGVTNFAYYLAKNGVRYSDGSANNLTHRTFEAIQYYLLKASALLAKEQGFCAAFLDTNYAIGKLPIDTYKRDIDAVHTESLHLDWDELRRLIANYGLRNSTLSALMPCETSSQITNSTNGIEPPRGLVSVKQSKDGTLRQVVPQIGQVEYELLWDIPSNKGYLELVGIMQKFIDQSISANTNYDPRRFPGDKVPMKVLLQDLMYAYKMGVKTLYYHNTRDGSGDGQQDDGCASGACKL